MSLPARDISSPGAPKAAAASLPAEPGSLAADLRGRQSRTAAKGVVVIGMHRSGTSAVTRVINLLGVRLGREADLFTAPDNPSGHWESKLLCLCNDFVLARFHGTWWSPPLLRASWSKSRTASSLLPNMRQSFDDVYDGGQWLWKDPRLSITLPLWSRLLSDFCVVLVVRNPRSVERSLRNRDHLPRSYGLALWDYYNRMALRSAVGHPTAVVHFDRLVEDPRHTVGRLETSLSAFGLALRGGADEASASVRAERVGRPLRTAPRLTSELWSHLAALPERSTSFCAVPDGGAIPLWVRAQLRSAKVASTLSRYTQG